MENSRTTPENGKSVNEGWHSLTRREKLFFALIIPSVLVGFLALVATVGLLAASFFVSMPHLVWLTCFGAGGAVLASLFAEPYLRAFFGSGWTVFRNNIIYFWLLVLSVTIATFKAFASPARSVVLVVLLVLLILDGALRRGYVQATWFFVKHRHLKPKPHS